MIYGYTRVSTDRQADEGESLSVQQRQLEGWCMMKGTQLDQLFVEAGVSGSVHVEERPQGAEMLSLLKRGDTVVATKLDRMFRSALDALQTLHDFNKQGITLVLLDLGGEVNEGMAKLLLQVAAAFAEAERDRITERIRTSKRHAKEQGRYLGGNKPFGYRVVNGGLVADAREQTIIAELRKIAGRSSIRKARLEVMKRHGIQLSLWTAAKLCAEG